MSKYYSGEILFSGVLRRYVSQNIVAVTVTLRLNRFTLLYVFNGFSQLLRCEVALHFINTWDINNLTFDRYWKQLQLPDGTYVLRMCLYG